MRSEYCVTQRNRGMDSPRKAGHHILCGRHLCTGAYGGRHMDCMGGPAHQLAIHKSGGLRISVTPRRGSTFGAQRSDRLILLHHRQLCTQIMSLRSSHLVGDHCLDFGVTACSLCNDHVFPSRVSGFLVLLLGLKRLGNADGATLSICCLNASVSLAWTAL